MRNLSNPTGTHRRRASHVSRIDAPKPAIEIVITQSVAEEENSKDNTSISVTQTLPAEGDRDNVVSNDGIEIQSKETSGVTNPAESIDNKTIDPPDHAAV